MIIKVLLELIRIIVLLGIYFRAALYAVQFLGSKIGMAPDQRSQFIIWVFCLITFYLWYRKKGQYSGWYPVHKG